MFRDLVQRHGASALVGDIADDAAALATLDRLRQYPTPGDLACEFSAGLWQWAPHLNLLSSKLSQAIYRGGLRLIVSMPPRHGKSHLTSVWTPVWLLHVAPYLRIVLASYAAEFASSWGREVRNISQHPENLDRLAFRLAEDSKAAHRWNTSVGGSMITAGVAGQITGRGADVLLVDDPIKRYKDAASKKNREDQWDWWTKDAYSRLEPGGSAVVVMTRWHEDDLAGRLIADMKSGGEQWEVISFPAIAEAADVLGRQPGQALWPARYDEVALARIKRSVGSYGWAALYQQRPAPLEGGMFSRTWFGFVDKPPKGLKWARYWDMASTQDGGDWTVGTLLGLDDQSSEVYIADVRRFQQSPGRTEHLIRHQAKVDGIRVPIRMEQEPGASGKHSIATYAKLLRGYDFAGIPSTESKEERARPLSAAAENGLVNLVRAEWNNEWLHEFETFPNAAHDDQVDSASSAYGFLCETLGEHDPVPMIWSVET